jgi:hypothetical protein
MIDKNGYTYTTRNENLKQIGFNDYSEYLASELWLGIRSKVLKKNNRCKVCSRKAVVVHHRNYSVSVLLGKKLKPLVSLCRGCHDLIEFDGGVKRTLKKANSHLDRLVQLTFNESSGEQRSVALSNKFMRTHFANPRENEKAFEYFGVSSEDKQWYYKIKCKRYTKTEISGFYSVCMCGSCQVKRGEQEPEPKKKKSQKGKWKRDKEKRIQDGLKISETVRNQHKDAVPHLPFKVSGTIDMMFIAKKATNEKPLL